MLYFTIWNDRITKNYTSVTVQYTYHVYLYMFAEKKNKPFFAARRIHVVTEKDQPSFHPYEFQPVLHKVIIHIIRLESRIICIITLIVFTIARTPLTVRLYLDFKHIF
jgi:hypothetical protein